MTESLPLKGLIDYWIDAQQKPEVAAGSCEPDHNLQIIAALQAKCDALEAEQANLTQAVRNCADLIENQPILQARCDALEAVAKDLHWMARRYADGSQSYATGLFNQHTKSLLALSIELNPCGENTIWARDMMGPQYCGLTQEEYDQGEPLPGYMVETYLELQTKCDVLAEALRHYANKDRWYIDDYGYIGYSEVKGEEWGGDVAKQALEAAGYSDKQGGQG